ncbi:MAG: excinuclease ABC subunit UvrA, partial [Planctomycetes bacterium]|nr:excinuclease ABC subunit UvrA [Planctomycetota bacterium]
ITEVTDHLRLLFARLGTPHCPSCDDPISAQTPDQVVDRILAGYAGEAVMVLSPIVHDRKGEYRKELEELRSKGYVRARIDGEVRRLDEPIKLARYERHTIEVILDRVKVSKVKRGRLTEAVEQGFRLGKGQCSVTRGNTQEAFSSSLSCRRCEIDIVELEPRLFSFNSPHGACPRCDGLGQDRDVDERLIIDVDKTVDGGAVIASAKGGFALRRQMRPQVLVQVCDFFRVPRDKPWKKLTDRQKKVILWGNDKRRVPLEIRYQGKKLKYERKERRIWRGVIPIIRQQYKDRRTRSLEKFLAPAACPECEGTRLRPEARGVRFRGASIGELSSMAVSDLFAFVDGVSLAGAERTIGERLLRELKVRLEFLDRVGLGYLAVHRSAATLSGGESQRIRLATQVGSGLRGILYVLDEPSIGLHQRDNLRLIQTLEQLRDAGNTVLVVEHDEETIQASDWVVDVGPGAGAHGGRLVAAGTPSQIKRSKASITGQFLARKEEIPVPATRREADDRRIVVRGARAHNLKGIDVPFPPGQLVCVTGVSGSGKSTLIDLILKRELARVFHKAEQVPGAHDAVEGLEHLDKVIEIDQSPIGRTPRSNPGTYTKVFGLIRDLFASLPEAKARGYKKGRFSFNVKGGRCEECRGAGVKVVEMQFLADVTVPCEECGSRRFNPETLEVRYREKSVNDVLEMPIEEALEFFKNHPKIVRVLDTLQRVGLGYMRVGQPSTTLSGGEAQRVKLASQLHRPPTGRTLYLLDEPTTGLHFVDIRRLLDALQALVDKGNTVVVIEHNLDVVKCADWIVDLGPEGGDGGGELVYAGPFDGVLAEQRSYTGQVLKQLLSPKRAPRRARRRKSLADRALDGDICITGAAMHNLKRVDVRFPAGKLSVVTGPSGSGKTSLAFDTLFAEGQRRFVECLSTYARQFLGRLERPPLDSISGLAPAIAIDQKTASRNPRSTVATTTEIQDYLRLLYARLGVPHCPTCGGVAQSFAPDQAWRSLRKALPDAKGRVLAPLYVKGLDHGTLLKKPTQLKALAGELKEAGFRRLLIDGAELKLGEKLPALSKKREIWLVVDRVQLKPSARTRVLDSIGQAYARGYGVAAFESVDGARRMLSELPGCAEHGFLLQEELAPRMFSFNSHVGACEDCHGLGVTLTCDADRLIVRPDKPLFDGAFVSRPGDFLARGDGYFRGVVETMCDEMGADIDGPWKDLPQEVKRAILYGGDDRVSMQWESRGRNREATWEMEVRWKGFCRYIEEWHRTSSNAWWIDQLDPLMRRDVCPGCEGARLKPAYRAVTVGDCSLSDVGRMTVQEARAWVLGLKFRGPDADVAEQILKELTNRLGFLEAVGLEYLNLSRTAATLSGGEAQRIRLATQIGNRLTGVIYVLDEPTIGLHQRDTDRLLATLKDLRDLGNSVVVVEHDRDTIDAADWIVDLGPGAGKHGGEVVYQGERAGLDQADGLTADYVTGRKCAAPRRARRTSAGSIALKGATTNNLKSVAVDIPLGSLVCVTGVSGSGKSSLVMDTLAPAMESQLGDGGRKPGNLGSIKGARKLADCVIVDQSPIGVSPRSNPASYVKILDVVRGIMAKAPLAQMRGYGPGRFSFNTPAGRCAACEGRGSIKVEMHFLPDVWVTCDDCKGRRYNRETLAVEYRGKTIADILEMEVSEARAFFENHRRVATPLQLLQDVGLGYMNLGQSATTLSGGEAQRIKLARELGRRVRGKVLYLLDEPTTGLHFDDVVRLMEVLHRLVDHGHTVVVIEHNLDVIKGADWIIDLGPEGGDGGGEVIAAGTPEDVASHPTSWTGRILAGELQPGSGRERGRAGESNAESGS